MPAIPGFLRPCLAVRPTYSGAHGPKRAIESLPSMNAKSAGLFLAFLDLLIVGNWHATGAPESLPDALMGGAGCFILGGLLCVFGSERLGAFTGPIGRGGYVSEPTPAEFFVFFGILLLVAPVVLASVSILTEHEVPPKRAARSPHTLVVPAETPIFPMVSPSRSLPALVTITTPVEMPVSIRGKVSGNITLPRGTRVKLLSVGGGTVNVQFLDSTAAVPIGSTDLSKKIDASP